MTTAKAFGGQTKRPKGKRKPPLKRSPAEPMQVCKYNFTVIFTPAEEGGYIVTCPVLPGLVTEGDTLAEAREMAQEAIAGYIEVLLKDGQSIPQDSRLRAEQIFVSAYV
ncbi:MAG: type II toxin-antitoxin system HicB family antitoxin [Pyrinomonadaceae bacterium]